MPDIPQLVGFDGEFIGVNSRLNADNLTPGYVSLAINRRFQDKTIQNRWGVVRPKWGGLWSNASQRFEVNSKDNTWRRGSAGAAIPVGTIVCSDTVRPAGPIIPNGTRVVSDNNTNCVLSTDTYAFSPTPDDYYLTYYSSTAALTDVVGILKYRDKTTGAQALLVASNTKRSTDNGQGRVFLLRPNQAHLEIPMNGHDFYDRVKLIQCGDSVVMLRPGPARYYFDGTDVNGATDTITLNVTPDLQTGDRVALGQLGTQAPLWTGSTGSGQGFGLYVNVSGTSITLHLSQNNALAGTNKLNLNTGLVAANRFYLELQNNTTSYDITQGLESFQNDGLPLIMQSSYSGGDEVTALDKGFDRVPSSKSIVAASADADTITVPTHNFVAGDQVTISNSSGGGVADGIYYVYPVDENTLRLFSGDTEETDSLNDAERATFSVNTSGTSPSITVTTLTTLNQGAGYLEAPTLTFSSGTAAATATITDGKVTATNVSTGGAYTSAPTVTAAMPSTLVDITGTLTGTIKKSSASGASIPAGREGLYFQNRLLMVYGNDYLAVSDVLDPLHYSKVLNDFKLNTGANDRVVAIAAFNSTTLVVFKQRSILAVENLYGDLGTVRLTEVTREFGCVAPNSVVNTGSDLIFLSQRGVVSLKQTEFGISQSVIVPLSDTIQNLVNQIDEQNWEKSCAAYFDNRYLLAHPKEGGDGSNQRIISYNFLTSAWEGYWEGSMLAPRFFERLVVSGTERLVFSDETGFVHYFDRDCLTDRKMTGEEIQIETEVWFRGYTCDAPEHKQWTDLQTQVRNWNTRYNLSTAYEGIGELNSLQSNVTKSRTTYYKYGLTAYDPTNVDDNFYDSFREDYSTLPVLRCGDEGWAAGLHQVFQHKARLRGHASAIQPVLTTDRGSLIVETMKVVGIPFRLYGKTDV